MPAIGRVESVWRYPVKSMAGEEMPEVYAGFAGIWGDRFFASKSAATPAGFPYLTAREAHQLLMYRPRFRDPQKAAKPANLTEAEEILPLLNPVAADPSDFALDIESPSGELLPIDGQTLLQQLNRLVGTGHSLTLLRSERAMTDCRPISLFSLQTAQQLGEEVGCVVDKRRFRANVYLDLGTAEGFFENALVGHKIRIGSKVIIAVLERDPRCQMITLDPDTATPNPEVLRAIARAHEGTAGIYGAVLAEGIIRSGDTIEMLD